MARRPDLLIVGGDMIGCAAYELAKTGLAVTGLRHHRDSRLAVPPAASSGARHSRLHSRGEPTRAGREDT